MFTIVVLGLFILIFAVPEQRGLWIFLLFLMVIWKLVRNFIKQSPATRQSKQISYECDVNDKEHSKRGISNGEAFLAGYVGTKILLDKRNAKKQKREREQMCEYTEKVKAAHENARESVKNLQGRVNKSTYKGCDSCKYWNGKKCSITPTTKKVSNCYRWKQG